MHARSDHRCPPSISRRPRWRALARGLLGLGLTSVVGCYSGLDRGPPAGGGDDAADDGVGDDGDPSREPAAPADPPPFTVPTDEARLLPFPVRMHNLARVTGQTTDHPMFAELWELRYQLGDHDFASGVAADTRWSAEKMQNWARGLAPVCDSSEMLAAYPDLLTDPRPLMREAWGHEPHADAVEAMAELQGPMVPEDQRYRVTCMAIFSALEFVSI